MLEGWVERRVERSNRSIRKRRKKLLLLFVKQDRQDVLDLPLLVNLYRLELQQDTHQRLSQAGTLQKHQQHLQEQMQLIQEVLESQS